MKSHLSICMLFLLFFTNNFIAQEFAPIGAKWYYTTYLFTVDNHFSPRLLEVTGEVEIENVTWKKLESEYYQLWQIGEFYIREENEKVYFKFKVDSPEFMLFDKNPQIGDIWYYPYDDYFSGLYYYYNGIFENPIDSIRLRVENISTVTINGNPTKKIQFSKKIHNEAEFLSSTDIPTYYLFESFGFLESFFLLGSKNMMDWGIPCQLVKYEDNYWGEVNFNMGENCNSVWEITSVEQLNKNEQYKIYPNPASDFLIISNKNSSLKNVILTDISGRVLTIIESLESQSTMQLYIDNLSTGVYFIILKDKNGRVTKEKFIKL